LAKLCARLPFVLSLLSLNALSLRYSPILGRDLDPLTQILVTVGASEGLFSGINGLVSPGDEVIGALCHSLPISTWSKIAAL
jgi:hypothetical protein